MGFELFVIDLLTRDVLTTVPLEFPITRLSITVLVALSVSPFNDLQYQTIPNVTFELQSTSFPAGR